MKWSRVHVEVKYCLKSLYYFKLWVSFEEPFAVVKSEAVIVVIIGVAQLTF